jgi:hypothetical protein
VAAASQPAQPGACSGRRIVLTTFGSLGDLHPYIAVALGLKARGHEAVFATSGYYRQKAEALGLGFRAVRPDHPDPEADPELMRRVMDRRTGSEFVIRQLMMSVLRDSYEDTLAAAEGADLLVSHMLAFRRPIVRPGGRPRRRGAPPAGRPGRSGRSITAPPCPSAPRWSAPPSAAPT